MRPQTRRLLLAVTAFALVFIHATTPAFARSGCSFCHPVCPSTEYGIALCNRECGQSTTGVDECSDGPQVCGDDLLVQCGSIES